MRVLIIGAGAGGPKVAARLRRLAPEAEITMVDRGRIISHAGCGMPFYVAGTVKDFGQLLQTPYGVTRDEAYFAGEKGVRVLTRTEAVGLDRARKEVNLANLDTGERLTLPYDRLVLATGARPFALPVEGADLAGIHFFHRPEEVQGLLTDLGEASEVVVVGAGLIGLEVAEALTHHPVFVTVVEQKEQILPALLDPDMARVLQARLEEKGLDFRLGARVVRFEGNGEGRVARVVTEAGTLDADLVVVAAGVRPNVELARAAGLTVGVTGALEVTERMQTNDPDIYAVGDCVETTHLVSGRKVYAPLASIASRQARVAADNLAGGEARFRGALVTAVARLFEYSVGRTGLGLEEALGAGFNAAATLVTALDRPAYYPGQGLILLKLVTEEGTGRILGGQAVGAGEVVKRVDVLATLIRMGGTVADLAEVDLGYSPPFSTPLDALHHLANTAANKRAGLARTLTAAELRAKIDRGDDFVILDVRTPAQSEAKPFKDPRVVVIPLGELRARLDELPRNKEIVVVCPQGLRSYEAQCTLRGAGFEEVRFLEGGLNTWVYKE
ncbi:MAG: FAD-dependent oxidoreductase [Bacillota bacterium]